VVVVLAVPQGASAGGLARLSGSTRGFAGGSAVQAQRKTGAGWTQVASGRTSKRGVFVLTFAIPPRRGTLVVRVAAVRGGRVVAVSQSRRLHVKVTKSIVAGIVVHAVVLDPSVVGSVPSPGQPGKLVYAGGNDVQAGQIIAIATGPATPYGFLGRATAVAQQAGGTVVSTQPVSLLEAVPQGSIDAVLTTGQAQASRATARAAAKKPFSCTGSASATITADASFSASLDFKANWRLVGGLQSASLTANASAEGSLAAAAQAAVNCTLTKTAIVHFNGPTATFWVGPVPVVLTSQITVYVDANAGANAALTSGVGTGFSATAGIGWTKHGGFQPIHTFNSHLNYTPPTLTASAHVAANLTPTVDVLLYGLAGPEIALKAGLALNADTTANPWWTLTAPIDLTASLTVPDLKLSSPTLHVYQHTFTLATASGPFGGSGTGSGGGTPTGGGTTGGGGPPGSTGPTGGGSHAAQAISAGGDETCVLLVGAGPVCTGYNIDGQLGDGTSTGPQSCSTLACSTTPVAVSGTIDAAAISLGDAHTCALLSGGSVDCWGLNNFGQLGNGTSTGPQSCSGMACSTTPVVVSAITNATAISAGTWDTCALLSGGSVDCWGLNYYGQLGDGTSTGPQNCNSYPCSATPVAVSGITNAKAVSVGGLGACALLSGGSVECWGENSAGQLGDGTFPGPGTCSLAVWCSTTPVTVSGITTATAISVGERHACALLSGGSVECWGDNASGELGDGTATGPSTCTNSSPCATTPVVVSGITNATAISAGFDAGLDETCALLSGGSVDCWGANASGELGDGTSTGPSTCFNGASCSTTPVAVSGITNATGVSVGGAHACALLFGGSVECWGDNSVGELGDGDTNSSDLPVRMSGLP
jgi:alpha-tubulin suppressor-like RCC1 family protein